MSLVTSPPSANRVILHDVSWDTYERLLNDLDDNNSQRIAFDQGVMEIVSPLPEHEKTNRALAAIVEIALEEMDIDSENLGSATFKRETLRRGFEPDSCFYIGNAGRIRHKKRIDLDVDPPPDLVIEIDLTSDSRDKFPLYAALGVPEVWRFERSIEMMTLEKGSYVKRSASAAIPILTAKLVLELIRLRVSLRRPEWLRQVRSRIRKLI